MFIVAPFTGIILTSYLPWLFSILFDSFSILSLMYENEQVVTIVETWMQFGGDSEDWTVYEWKYKC